MVDESSDPRPPAWGKLRPGMHPGRSGPYLVGSELCNAANTALLLGRPLLLTGEPGCGKTEFAWVMAHALEFSPILDAEKRQQAVDEAAGASARGEHPGGPWEPLQCYVRSEMTSRDLLYHYDALLRFADAHHPDPEIRSAKAMARYFELRGLGKALVWPIEERPAQERPVLLIDEIDKAPRDLPNDLLRSLDVGEFEISELREDDRVDLGSGFVLSRTMGSRTRPKAKKPFVVITSNVEQRLPEPFLRRCVFLYLKFPDRKQLEKIVAARPAEDDEGNVHRLDPPLIGHVLDVFLALREVEQLAKKPGTAELIDWTHALALYWKPSEASRILAELASRLATQRSRVSWKGVPGLECLLKLHEDLETVGAITR